jgi:hypothetical protein
MQSLCAAGESERSGASHENCLFPAFSEAIGIAYRDKDVPSGQEY